MRPTPAHALHIVATLALTLGLGACSTGSGGAAENAPIVVKGYEYRFDPATITVQHGQQVNVRFENRGTIGHNWKVVGVPGAAVDENGAVRQLANEVPPGQQERIQFTAPDPGTWRFVCDLPGHAEAGMVGQLVVK